MILTKMLYIKALLTVALLFSFTVGRLSAQSKFINQLEWSDASKADSLKWQKEGNALKVAFGSTDVRYLRHQVPDLMPDSEIKLTAWRGERVNIQMVLWSNSNTYSINIQSSDLTIADKHISAAVVKAFPVRYVLTDATTSNSLVPDMLDNLGSFSISGKSSRPVWITIAVPTDAKPTTYKGSIEVKAKGGFKKKLNYILEVQDRVLPKPSEWQYHLDLLQNPWAVSRIAAVPQWSKAHWEALRSTLTMLAQAGQKCITTTMIHDPWGGQSLDPYESMVDWRKSPDGSWTYDFTVFDQWVEFVMSCGIKEQINCYSIIPRQNSFRYFDETKNEYKIFTAVPGSPAFENHWRPFLLAFREHLQNKGWLDKTCIVMDEHATQDKLSIIKFIKATTPELKIAFAAGMHSEMVDSKQIYSNNFMLPQLAENTLVGWLAGAGGNSGSLSPEYNSWGKDPEHDARLGSEHAGDTYMVYPGARSSIRFERLREGIQDYEKIRILKEAFEKEGTETSKQKLNRLNEMLKAFTLKGIAADSVASIVNRGKEVLNELSR